MRRGKAGSKSAEHLQLIKGKNKIKKEKEPKAGRGLSGKKKPRYILLIFLAIFLLAQVLVGWLLGYFGRASVETAILEEGSKDVKLGSEGVVTFEEEVVLAEETGYVYFKVSEGERVPRGKEIACILEQPVEESNGVLDEAAAAREHLEATKRWLLGEQAEEGTGRFSTWPKDAKSVAAPSPGVVSFTIDGLEKYGPENGFPYPCQKADQNETTVQERKIKSGERIHRFMPLFKLINNYHWYYSTVLPVEKGEAIAELSEVKLRFSFDPDRVVTGRIVEAEQDEKAYKITWMIKQSLKNFERQRLVEAELIYDRLTGILVPASALIEKEGRHGAYVVNKGLVEFQEVSVLGEKEGYYLVKQIEPHVRVVTSPGRVTEGERLY